jgi:rod shape-determining protein MreD
MIIIIIIIFIISLLLDGVLTNYLPYLVNDLSLFTPLLTLTSIFIIYPFYKKREKNYFITVFIIGIIYDLFYTNMLFFNAILFLIIGIITKFIYKNFNITYIKLIIYLTIIITIYESLTCLILIIFNLVPVTLYKLFYKISHSLLLNIIYGEILLLIINLIPKKYKKININ